jgi:hypothetical protein
MDNAGRIILAPASSASSSFGTADGYILLASTNRAALYQTVYTEQTSNAQRSIKSSNANDSANGTGARTIRITYTDASMSQMYTEIITLNGTTAVNTASSNYCFIEKIEVMTAGSVGYTVGAISLYAGLNGTGGVIWSIAANETKTYGAHHYVVVNKTCNMVSMTTGGARYSATYAVRAQPLGANTVNQQISDSIHNYSDGGTGSALSASTRTYPSPIRVAGPAHLQMFVDPDQASSTTYYGSFDYYDS